MRQHTPRTSVLALALVGAALFPATAGAAPETSPRDRAKATFAASTEGAAAKAGTTSTRRALSAVVRGLLAGVDADGAPAMDPPSPTTGSTTRSEGHSFSVSARGCTTVDLHGAASSAVLVLFVLFVFTRRRDKR